MKNKLRALWLFMKITAKNDPLYIPVIILNALAPAAATMVNVFVPMIFINQITDPKPADQFIKIVVLLIIGKILLESLERLLNREEFVRRQGINDYLTFELAKKAMDLTLSKHRKSSHPRPKGKGQCCDLYGIYPQLAYLP